MTKFELLQILTGFLGTCGFAILFNIRGRRWIFAVLGGLISWTLFVVLGFFFENEPLRYFIVSLLLSVYAEVMARVLKTPTTTFIMTSLIPLIPGGSLYYTMSHAISGEWGIFTSRALYTMQLAVALALGIVAVAAVTGSRSTAAERHRAARETERKKS